MYSAETLRGILGKQVDPRNDPTQFVYSVTEHPCPACGQGLLRVEPSSMLVCSNKDTDPLFLV